MFATRLLRLASSARAFAATSSATRLSPRLKATTGVTGVDVHPSPLTALSETYSKTLSLLSTLPESSVYRQSTTALTQHHLDVINDALQQQKGNESNPQKIEEIIEQTEKKLEWSMIEDGVRQAQTELELVAKMLDWKPWEPLEQPPPPGQWHYFSMAEEAGEGGEDQNVEGGRR
ncbi:hypothetical protein ACQY0O_006152 [Thecaphora frezii]